MVRVRQGMEPDIIVRLPDGTHAAIAMHLTDYAAPPVPEAPPTAAHLLDLRGLRHVLHLLERLRAAGGFPPPAAQDTAAQAPGAGYD